MFEGLKQSIGMGAEQVVVYSEKTKMVRFLGMILVPFYIVWGLFNFLFFMEYPWEWSFTLLCCGFCMWGTGIVVMLNKRQMEATEYHCFRGLTWRMSVTRRIKADVYVDRRIEYIGKIGGYQVYKPYFPFALMDMHPNFNNGEGVIFNKAFWLLPDKWEQTFFPVPQQEAWYGSLPVTVKAEDVTLHNLRWAMKDGEYIPIALVVDSNRHFESTIGRVKGLEQGKAPEVAQFVSEIASLTKDNINLALELTHEVQANRGLLEETPKVKELVNAMVEDIKKRHGDIKRMPTPWKLPKINWRLVMFTILGLAIISGIIYVIVNYW